MIIKIEGIQVKPGRRSIDRIKVQELADSIKAIGMLNPITVKPDFTLIAGAHRLEAARLLGWAEVEVNVSHVSDAQAELAEIDENLMRNELHYIDRGNAINRRDELLTEAGLRAKPHRPDKGEINSPLITTTEIASQIGISKRTMLQEKQIARDALPEVQQAIKSADLPKNDAIKIARLEPNRQMQVATKLNEGAKNYADATREIQREEITERLNEVSTREVKRMTGKFDVIVIDPPWPMQKIERDERPNQVALDYPTMTEGELADMQMPAADDCHLWLWTTQKFLPMALRLLDAWEMKYVCTFVWHKNGGPQPFGLPQYNCEFALYARKGTPKFIDTRAFNTCFNAARGDHSEKPSEFYDVVRRVTAGARVDIFNRRKIEGFDGWGNEAGV